MSEDPTQLSSTLRVVAAKNFISGVQPKIRVAPTNPGLQKRKKERKKSPAGREKQRGADQRFSGKRHRRAGQPTAAVHTCARFFIRLSSSGGTAGPRSCRPEILRSMDPVGPGLPGFVMPRSCWTASNKGTILAIEFMTDRDLHHRAFKPHATKD